MRVPSTHAGFDTSWTLGGFNTLWTADTPWNGNCTSGQRQQVTPSDALALAAALEAAVEAALPDIPGENTIPRHKGLITRPHQDNISLRLHQVGDGVQDEASITGLENITDFIEVPLPSGTLLQKKTLPPKGITCSKSQARAQSGSVLKVRCWGEKFNPDRGWKVCERASFN
jgi:hypothetical protein